MRLYTMKCVKDPELLPEEGGGMLGQEEYFVKLDNNEDEYYSNRFEDNRDTDNYEKAYAEWSVYMTSKLGEIYEDDEIYFYLCPEDPELEIGDTYEDADGLVWERVE